MSSDFLNDRVIKLAGVAQEVPRDIVRMLDSVEDSRGEWELRPLSKLCPLSVEILHPGVMISRCNLVDMLLEDDDIRVGDMFGIG